jgi:hypothetical protein
MQTAAIIIPKYGDSIQIATIGKNRLTKKFTSLSKSFSFLASTAQTPQKDIHKNMKYTHFCCSHSMGSSSQTLDVSKIRHTTKSPKLEIFIKQKLIENAQAIIFKIIIRVPKILNLAKKFLDQPRHFALGGDVVDLLAKACGVFAPLGVFVQMLAKYRHAVAAVMAEHLGEMIKHDLLF